MAPGDPDNEAQMTGNERVRRVAIAVLAPVFGQNVFLLRSQHREPPDFLKIMGEAGFGPKDRQGRGASHDKLN
jgi:hypothetical protein